jgi:hypothetical protein
VCGVAKDDDREVMTLTNIAEGLYDCFVDTYAKTWLAYDHEPKNAPTQ